MAILLIIVAIIIINYIYIFEAFYIYYLIKYLLIKPPVTKLSRQSHSKINVLGYKTVLPCTEQILPLVSPISPSLLPKY